MKKNDVIILIILLLLAGILSVLRGQDDCWDLYNYHLYNPYAFLNGRIGADIAPAGKMSYANPILDVPYYFMVLYFNPKLTAFIQGLYFGTLSFVLYKICSVIFKPSIPARVFMICTAMLIGLSSGSLFGQLGTTFNEVQTAVLILICLYLFLKALTDQRRQFRLIAIAGLICGAAAGLKLTSAIYPPVFLLILIIFFKKLQQPVKTILLFPLFCAAGFLITNGFWMYILWKHFHNPFFPFFNGIFQSEYFEPLNYRDTRWLPRNWREILFFPFFFEEKISLEVRQFRHVCEVKYHDLRFALLYVSAVLTAGYAVIFKQNYRGIQEKLNLYMDFDKVRVLFTFILIAFVFWELQFSLIRYAAAVEALAGLVLVILLSPLIIKSKPVFKISVIILLIFLFNNTHICDWGHKPFSKERFSQNKIQLPPNSLIVLQDMPLSFIIPLTAHGSDTILTYTAHNENNAPTPYVGQQIKTKLNTSGNIVFVTIENSVENLDCIKSGYTISMVESSKDVYFCFRK
jgi:hypothetical protein